MRWSSGAIAATLLSLSALCSCQITAPSGASPQYVALVKLSELTQVPESNSGSSSSSWPHASAAAALRAAGYPASPAMSKPTLQRTAQAAAAAATDATAAAPGDEPGFASPVGLNGPTLTPKNQSSSSSSSSRRLQQQQVTTPAVAESFEGIRSPAPAGTSAIAVGPNHLLQASGFLLTVTNISSSTGMRIQNSSRAVHLASLMAGAAADCQDVFDPSAVFDHAADRFIVSATCGGQGRVLLAASTSSDANGAWFVSGLVADGANTSLACTQPVQESAIVDYTQVSYNADSIFITYKSLCPSNARSNSIGLLALPKHAVYMGIVNFFYAVYTSAELQVAVAAAAAGDAAGAGPCSQLQPVRPQGPADVQEGVAYFVCEQLAPVISASTSKRKITLAALLDTATLWKWGGPGSPTSTPMLAAQQAELGSPAAPPTGLLLRQPGAAPALQLGSRPLGFWNGAAVLAGGQIYLALPTMISNDLSSSSYSRRPAVAWLRLSVAADAAGTDSCPQSVAGREAAGSNDWTVDYSSKWAAEHNDAKAHSTQSSNVTASASFEPRLVGAASAGGSASETIIKAAGLFKPALLLGAAASASMALYGGRPCSCYACYWGGEYYNYGGYVGGNLNAGGVGYQGFGYDPQPGRVSGCDDTCTLCWYFGYPGNGFGNQGFDPQDPYFDRSTADLRDNSGVSSAQPPGEGGPTLGQLGGDGAANDAAGAYLASLFTPCTRSASLTVSVQREGVISQGGQRPLGLVFPAVAVAPSGQLLVVFSYAGPGNATASAPAYPGVGAAFIAPGAPTSSSSSSSSSSTTIRPIKLGKGTLLPSLPPGISSLGVRASSLAAGWAELSSAALHASSGRVFTAVHYAAQRQKLATSVGSWNIAWAL